MAVVYSLEKARAIHYTRVGDNMSNTEQRPPTFIQPISIAEMTDDQIDLMLEGIRIKRMQSKVIYDETQKVKEMARKVKLEGLIEKKLEKLKKAIDSIDKHLDKLETATNEIRALRMELGEKSL